MRHSNGITTRSSIMAGTVVIVLALAAPIFGASPQASVQGKSYQVNVISSFGSSFTDCFRFQSNNTWGIDGCGDSGAYGEQPLLGTVFATGWAGKAPCGGLNLQWFGSAMHGANFLGGLGADLISGTAVGETEGTTFAVNGYAVLTCPRSAAKNGVNYKGPGSN